MKALHARAAELGLVRLFSDVSLTAEPFFERFGFSVVERKSVLIGKIPLPNARMEKLLGPAIAR